MSRFCIEPLGYFCSGDENRDVPNPSLGLNGETPLHLPALTCTIKPPDDDVGVDGMGWSGAIESTHVGSDTAGGSDKATATVSTKLHSLNPDFVTDAN
jgi:hypothetical protein